MNKRLLEPIIKDYLVTHKALLDLCAVNSADLNSLIERHESVEAECLWHIRAAAKQSSVVMSMETKAPLWVLVALDSVLRPNEIPSVGTLFWLCGMDAHRHTTQEEAEIIIDAIRSNNITGELTETQVRNFASRVDMPYKSFYRLNKPATRANLLAWVTKPRYNRFLRDVCIEFGKIIAEDPSSAYLAVYQEALSADTERFNLRQLEMRARASATRAFLLDYFQAMQQMVKQKPAA